MSLILAFFLSTVPARPQSLPALTPVALYCLGGFGGCMQVGPFPASIGKPTCFFVDGGML